MTCAVCGGHSIAQHAAAVPMPIDVPAVEAIDYYARKTGQQPSFSWWEVDKDTHERAFAVAKMADTDMLRDVYASLDKALKEGVSQGEWMRKIAPLLKSKGWWGRVEMFNPNTGKMETVQLGSEARLALIFRQNLMTSYAAGKWQRIVENAEYAPFLRYVGIVDKRIRPMHLTWHNTVLPWDHPFWKTHFPPNGWNSVLPWQRVSCHAHVGLKAWYSGKIVEVVGRSGGRFTVTAQHPVLTRHGWVDAQFLRKGDQLLAYRGVVGGASASADFDEHNAPPTIEQIFDTLSRGGRCSVPASALDLNGDALFFNGDVEVVGADRVLVNRLKSEGDKLAAEINLANSGLCLSCGHRSGARGQLLVADLPSVPYAPAQFGSEIRTLVEALGAPGVDRDAVVPEVCSNLFPALSDAERNIPQRSAGQVEVNNLRRHWLSEVISGAPSDFLGTEFGGLSFGAHGNSVAAKHFVGGFHVNANAHRDILGGQAGLVEVDDVVDLIVTDYSGHVYDLQTSSGNMAAFGGECKPQYIISNCRCSVIQMSQRMVDRLQAKGTKLKFEPPDDGTFEWKNPATGRVHNVPVGIDPGWDFNPGKTLAANTEAVARGKTKELDTLRIKVERTVEKVDPAPAETAEQRIVREVRETRDGYNVAKAAVREAVASKRSPAKADKIDAAKATRAAAKERRDAALAEYRKAVVPGRVDAAQADGSARLAKLIDGLDTKAADFGDALQARIKSKLAIEAGRLGSKLDVVAGPSPAADAEAKSAAKLLPKAWVDALNASGALCVRTAMGRAWCFSAMADDVKDGVRLAEGDALMLADLTDPGTTLHELTHAVQFALPEIDMLFQEIHSRRTEGAQQKRMIDLVPGTGYEPYEVTREDKYVDPYWGREYGARGALEVMSMSMQSVLSTFTYRRKNLLADLFERDRPMLEFILGVLFGALI